MADPYREPIEGGASEPQAEKSSAPEIAEKVVKPIETPRSVSAQEVVAPAPLPAASAPVAPASPAEPATQTPAIEKDRQLKTLVDLAFSQGIDKAVEAVSATGDAYLMDKFHDTLIDELHQQLVEKGKLKEV